MPIRIGLDNADNIFYIKSILKHYLKPIREPYFNIKVNTVSQKEKFRQEDGLRIIPQNGRFVLTNKRNINLDIGFIDRKKRFCQLDIKPEAVRTVFHSFLTSSCVIFLSDMSGFIIHAAGIIYKGYAYIFVGPSGSGKTTVASILKKKGLGIISDERVAIRRRGTSFIAFTFPWYDHKSQCAPLKKIFFLKKGKRVTFRRLNSSYATARIFPHITLNLPDKESTQKILNSLCLIFKKFVSYEMQFLRDGSFWQRLRDLD